MTKELKRVQAVHIFKSNFGFAKNGKLNPFWVIINKEIADHIRSWRFLILVAIISLTCIGSIYTALANIEEALKNGKADDIFVFFKNIYSIRWCTSTVFYFY